MGVVFWLAEQLVGF